MINYDGNPANAPPAYNMVGPGQYPLSYPPTAAGYMYPASNPTPAPGYTYPALNPTPAPRYMYPALNPTPEPAPARQIIMNVVPVGPDPSQVTCPSCRAVVVTRIERKATTRTHIVALVLCLFLCWPCVCVPYCMDSCRNADHYCPNCNSYLGTYAK